MSPLPLEASAWNPVITNLDPPRRVTSAISIVMARGKKQFFGHLKLESVVKATRGFAS